ncbi:sensor histidine kinase [cf. Phormidesmis sp. LEGE 11477]|uniref:sensor histidine kinase n=1 Tax=cf. Phormidesmis sp. LEGE 11477 TaxID=1828680 RepID=UPI001880C39E|nr:ATP-binding protein [cf. Phormidesmis sp. LEGE 11477]MBE9060481.1 hypothetical protein [cf. Phormidesmis sp. LEGE 11477]
MKNTFLSAFSLRNQPTSDKRFNLLRNFSIVSISGFAIAVLLLAAFYRRQAQQDLLRSTEEGNVAITHVLSDALLPTYRKYLYTIRLLDNETLLSDQTVRTINQKVVDAVDNSTIQKIKIFDLNGRVISSTDASQIGQDSSESPGFVAAKSGQVVSQIGHRDSFQAINQEITDRYLLSSYLPIRAEKDDNIIGVFEVYRDVTPLQQHIYQTQRVIVLGSVLILSGLYAVLFLFVRRADRLLDHQYREVLASEGRYRLQTDELEQALANLKQTQSRLIQSEKMSSLGQLVAGIAHEINNPVSFISGNIYPAAQYVDELLALLKQYQIEHTAPSETVQEMTEDLDLAFLAEDFPRLLQSIQMGSQRIKQIVAALRTFSRLDESERKPADLQAGIESTLMILQHRLKEQCLKDRSVRPPVEVVKNFSPLPLVTCSVGAMNQVFMNILINAIDALDEYHINQNKVRPAEGTIAEGTIEKAIEKTDNQTELAAEWTPQITISTELSSTQEAVITITNNGPIIPENIQEKIFDPFFTTKPVGKGIGLGLSTSHTIVTQQNKGRLLCVSTPEAGTQFIIKLPLS